MSINAYARQYRQTATTSAVLDADPHRLIALMFTGVRERLRRAAACIEVGNVAAKGQAIIEASTIIGHLDDSLNHEAGGEIAENLAALYDYVQRRLVEANLKSDIATLNECDALFAEIETAWNSIASTSTPTPGKAASISGAA